MKEAIFLQSERRHSGHKENDRSLKYIQATKKDSQIITKGKYLMATTKPGNCIPQEKDKCSKGWYKVDVFDEGAILGSLKVKYRIKNTLLQMGKPVVVLSDEDTKYAPTHENILWELW